MEDSRRLVDILKPEKESVILVYDVHASESGALSILNDFYEQVCRDKDKSVQWIFVVSKPEYEEKENIKVLRYSWVKKSWFHRLYFDVVIGRKIIKKYKPVQIFSLQNMGIPFFKGKQTVYLHLPMILCEYRFHFWKKEKKEWIYQNVLGRTIFRSLAKAAQVIVQTNWMKEALVKRGGIERERILVQKPEIRLPEMHTFEEKEKNYRCFFYPATSYRYKNHMTFLKAVNHAVENGMRDYVVILTVKPKENSYTKELWDYTEENHLNVRFIGSVSREEVFKQYAESVLVFPSLVESFGMPLLEARLTGSPIIAGDCPFCHEILEGYEKATFFSPLDWRELGEKMRQMTDCEINKKQIFFR